jgi:hypothetical protein
MKKSKKPLRLGVVPRALLKGAISGAIPACALAGCTDDGKANSDAAADVGQPMFGVAAPPPDPRPDGGIEHPVDAPTFIPPDAGPERPLFSVALPPPDPPRDAAEAGHDTRPLFSVDAPVFGVADVGFGKKS